MMTNIRLSNPSDLKSLLVIENNTNPSPWTEKQMQSSFDVGHHSFLCEDNNENVIGFVIYAAVEQEAHLLNIAMFNKCASCSTAAYITNPMTFSLLSSHKKE